MVTEAWENVACRDWNAKIVYKLELNKIYIQQIYHEHFVEFESIKKWEAFKVYADEHLYYWDYDCPRLIDTSDMEQAANWYDFLKDKDKFVVKKTLVPKE